jgi:branched-chain amino acid transport system ATP-binding protein
MLELAMLRAGYGAADVLHEVSFRVPQGSFCALIGANGAGKSTTLKALAGLVRPVRGRITFEGESIGALSAAQIVGRGIALVPEGRRVFGPLTVRENLQMGAFSRLFSRRPGAERRVAERLAFVLETFPRLQERLAQEAATLSGGEQQMLAIGRALMSEPRLLLLDEPSMGLAPLVVQQVFDVLRRLQRSGLTLLVSEQNANAALAHADRGCVIESGRIVMDDSAAALRGNDKVREAYLGI